MYNERTKKNTMKYLAKLKEVRFRVKPEEYDRISEACVQQGYPSIRQFILAAIRDKMCESYTCERTK